MNLTINKGGHIADRKEIHINGKAVETDGLTGAMLLQRKGEPAQLILTYDIDDLYIDDLVSKTTEIKFDGISARQIAGNDVKARGIVVGDQMLCSCLDGSHIEDLASQIAEQTAEEMRRTLK